MKAKLLNMLMIATALILGGCNNNEQKTARPEVTEDQIQQKIAGVNFSPYSRSRYPKLWASIGPALKDGRVDQMRIQAARAAAAMTECDRVELSEVSQSSTLDNIVIFVDCTNGFRVKSDEKLRIEKIQTRP